MIVKKFRSFRVLGNRLVVYQACSRSGGCLLAKNVITLFTIVDCIFSQIHLGKCLKKTLFE